MTKELLAIQAEIFACYARIESMRARNMQRQAVGSSMAYDEASFIGEAATLLWLAN